MKQTDIPKDSKDKIESAFFPAWNTANPYYYPLLKKKRKLMRDNMTEAESTLWEYLKSNKLGVKFRRQHIIDNFIPDFVSLTCKLIIELDGEIHNYKKEYDDDRTFLLNQRGYRVIRFKNEEIFQDIQSVIQKIKKHIDESTV